MAGTPDGESSGSSGGRGPLEAEDLPPGLLDDLRLTFEPRFQLKGLLGRGGMGVVLEAYDPVLERPLAIKVLATDAMSDDPAARERLLREARAAATLDHPNVVSIFGVGETPTLRAPYILMQRVLGASLERLEAGAAPIDVAGATRILGDVAAALTAAHARGLIHRDLKPSNVVVDGPTGRAVVLDFGISHWAPSPERKQEDRLTGTGMFVGTPTYMSPEQATGETLTDRADIYSLGCLIYELLAGRPVFDGTSPMSVIASHINVAPVPIRTLRPDVPEGFARVLMAMLAKRPGDRPSADDLRRRFAPPPDHHPWETGAIEAIRRRLRLVVLSGGALATLSVAQYGFLTGLVPITAPLVQSGILSAVVVALLLDAWAGLSAIGALRRSQLPSAVIQLVAGDWARDAGRTVDRLREFAGLRTEDQQRLLRVARARGSATLSFGPATLGVLVLLIVTPVSTLLPEWLCWVLLLLPALITLTTSARYVLVVRQMTGRTRSVNGHDGMAGDTAPFASWAARHPDLIPARESRSGRGAFRIFTHLVTIGVAVVCVALLAGIELIAGVIRSEDRIPDPTSTLARYADLVRVSDLAPPPIRPLTGDSARAVWDSLFYGGWRQPDSAAAVAYLQRMGDGRSDQVVRNLRGSGRGFARWGAPLMEHAYTGLTPVERQEVDLMMRSPRVPEFRAAARTLRSESWTAMVSLPTTAITPPYAWNVPDWLLGRDLYGRQLIAAAREIDRGRPDSAEVLLWEVIRFSRLRADGARNLTDLGYASGDVRSAVSALRVLYTRERRLDKLLPLLQAVQGEDEPTRSMMKLALGSDRGEVAAGIVRDTTLPPGLRWEMYSWSRFSSCGEPRVLLGGADRRFDSLTAVVRRDLVRDATDSTLVAWIDRGLVTAASSPSEERGVPARYLTWASEVANRVGKLELAGCLNAAASGVF